MVQTNCLNEFLNNSQKVLVRIKMFKKNHDEKGNHHRLWNE